MRKAMIVAGVASWLAAAILYALALFGLSGGGDLGSTRVEVSPEVQAFLVIGQVVSVANALLIVGAIFIAVSALRRPD